MNIEKFTEKSQTILANAHALPWSAPLLCPFPADRQRAWPYARDSVTP